jgi:hypothetical protein
MPQGEVMVFSQTAGTSAYPTTFHESPEFQVNSGFVTSALDWLELGAVVHRSSWGSKNTRLHEEVSLKVQVPRMDSRQPLLAFGLYDRFENMYFVAGYEFRSSFMMFGLDLGAIYQAHRNPFDSKSKPRTISFLGVEMDFGKASLLLESSWRKGAASISPSVWWKPLAKAPGEGSAGLMIGGGARLNTEEPASMPVAWGGAAVKIPLQRFLDTIKDPANPLSQRVSHEPFLWIDVNPVFDHRYSANGNQYRTAVDFQGATRLGVRGLYWVNGATSDVVTSKKMDSLVSRSPWDRSYLFFSRPKLHGGAVKVREPEVSLGMLQMHSLGMAIRQDVLFSGWSPSIIEGSFLMGNSSGFTAVLRQPIHPELPWFLRWTQLSIEAGRYADGKLVGFGVFKQGGEDNFFEASAGYDLQGKEVLVRAVLKFDVSGPLSGRVGGIQISALNNIRHRFEMGLASQNPDFVPAFLGNPPSEYAGIPWGKRRWRGDSLRTLTKASCAVGVSEWVVVAKLPYCGTEDFDVDMVQNQVDKCPEIAEDRDGFEDDDGCPDADNDGDRIPDGVDRCPVQAEDRDGFQDEDGCPDLDNDNDGVPDLHDACPLTPEDIDQFKDEDGCPDLDNDGDGVRDVDDICPNIKGLVGKLLERPGCPEQDDGDGISLDLDACPNAAEDFDGFEDKDGCPDLDNDNDGIPDLDDRCPSEPEIMDGIADTDGCP